MILDKVCFIHLRQANGCGDAMHNGGATVAWKVDSQTGNVEVGMPATCSQQDKFVKAEGRKLALENLHTKKPAFLITKEQLILLAKAEALLVNRNHTALTPYGRERLIREIFAAVDEDVFKFMASGWFELHVRNQICFDGKRVTFLPSKMEGQWDRLKEIIAKFSQE